MNRGPRLMWALILTVSLSACSADPGRWQSVYFSDPVCKQIGLSVLDYQEPKVTHVSIPSGVLMGCHRITLYGWQITRVDPILSPDQLAKYGDVTLQVEFYALADGSIGDVKVVSPASSNPYDPFVVGAVKRWNVIPTTDATRQQLAQEGHAHFTITYRF